MGLWSMFAGEKKEKKGEVPDYREAPFVAHVERIGPKDARARLILGKLGTVEDLHSKEDIHNAVRPRWNGGDYRARLFDQADRSDGYIATYSFTIPGEPWIDGKAVPMPEEEGKPKGKAGTKIAELRQKTAELKARQEVAAEEADLEQLRNKLAGQAEGHSTQVAGLQAQLQEMESRFEQQQEEFQEETREREERQREDEKERKREERDRGWRDESDKRFTELMKEIKGDKAGSAEASNLQVLMTAMQASGSSQMEMMKQIVTGVREQSNTLMNYMSQPSPAQAEAATARQQLMETLQVQLNQLQSSEHTKFENFMQFFLTLRQLAQQDMTSGVSGSVWADTARDIAKSIGQAVISLGDQRRTQALPSPQVDLTQIAEVAKKQAKAAIDNASRAANPAKPEPQEAAPPTPAPTPALAPVAPPPPPPPPPQPSAEAELRRRSVVAELLSTMAVELEERPNAPTWPQLAYSHLPADMLQILMKVETPEDFGNVVAMLEKYGDKHVVDAFVAKVQADKMNALWLAQGIAQIQQLAKG